MSATTTPPAPWIPLRRTRRPAVEVAIGDVVVGGTRPIAVQSMTTTRTSDAAATAAQAIALARAGCDIVRVTVPGRPDGEALPEIRRILAREGVRVPLVADIHFTPSLALKVVEHVEKVRVNPGNFTDRKSLSGEGYDEARWQQDVDRLYQLFAPLCDRAKELGVALRIGTNHGSLSDRIVWKYGDNPEGMVQSAIEFVRIAEDRGHRGLVISMKASNPQVMVRAYRLLARRLDEAGLGAYPLHLGVTEAGGGDEGRMKSAAGIGTLLADGLGDTIRVSLTEDPVHEVPVGRDIVRLFAVDAGVDRDAGAPCPPIEIAERRDPYDYRRRATARLGVGAQAYGGDEVPRVELVTPPADGRVVAAVLAARPPVELLDVAIERAGDLNAAFATLNQMPLSLPGPDASVVVPARGLTLAGAARAALLNDAAFAADLGKRLRAGADRLTLVLDAEATPDEITRAAAADVGLPKLVLLPVDGPLEEAGPRVVAFARSLAGAAPGLMAGLLPGAALDAIGAHRLLGAALDAAGARVPLVLGDREALFEDQRLGRTGRLAALLVDGLGDAVRLGCGPDPVATAALVHNVLQGCRRRLEKADYIACPSCGRTLFELEETTERVRVLTSHLKLKIAVMGCVVNGPGEMADADYGYVGWGEGKVALFVGKEMVQKDIPSAEAPERLVDLIRSRGHWTDPA